MRKKIWLWILIAALLLPTLAMSEGTTQKPDQTEKKRVIRVEVAPVNEVSETPEKTESTAPEGENAADPEKKTETPDPEKDETATPETEAEPTVPESAETSMPRVNSGTAYRTDLRIASIHSVYECGCDHYFLGAMVGRYGMVLGANSLYCSDHGGKVRQISFSFGRTEDNQPVVTYSGKFTMKAYETFREGIKWENNIAYIKFAEPLGDQTGWFKCRVTDNKEMKNRKLMTRQNVSAKKDPSGLLEQTIIVFPNGEKSLSYKQGDYVSGTPALMIGDRGEEMLVGLCTYRDDENNYVRRITERVYTDMKKDGVFNDGPVSATQPPIPGMDMTARITPPPEGETTGPEDEGEKEPVPEPDTEKDTESETEAPAEEDREEEQEEKAAADEKTEPEEKAETDGKTKPETGAEEQDAEGGEEPEVVTDSRIANLAVSYECGCTMNSHFGTMVGPNGMVVPAAALYCANHGKPYTAIQFKFGPRPDGSSFMEYNGEFTAQSYETFENGLNMENAIGYIRFPIAVGDTTGWFKCKAATDTELKAGPLLIKSFRNGYNPVDLTGEGSPNGDKIVMVTVDGKVYSGTPAFIVKDGEEPILAAVLVGKAGDGTIFGRRITTKVFKEMKRDGLFDY